MKAKIGVVLVLVLLIGSLTGCVFTDWIGTLLGNPVTIAKYEAETAARLLEIEREKTRGLEANVDLQREQNEGMIYKANAQAITRQSRAHVGLQGVMAVFAIVGLIAGGLLVAVLLNDRLDAQKRFG